MTDPIPFPAMPEEEDPQTLSREALLAQAQELQERIADLDAREPADMMSAQYERWAARHEALEDALGAYCRSFQRVLSDSAQENEHFTLTWEE